MSVYAKASKLFDIIWIHCANVMYSIIYQKYKGQGSSSILYVLLRLRKVGLFIDVAHA